jgi:integrase
MATLQKRTWLSRGPSGRRVRKVSWGYTLQVNGKQERKFSADWTEADARTELAKRILVKDTAKIRPTTLAQAAERYLQAKARKRSLAEDRRMLKHLVARFGAETRLSTLTSDVISQYRDERLSQPSSRRGNTTGLLSPCTINRELALLNHLLRLAHDEWNALTDVPRIRRLEEPQGRLRWLDPDEEARLLAACRRSRNAHLYAITVLALETGMRQGEVLGLTWERVDFSRGVIQLEVTKSGQRREIPMRQIVNDVLSELPGVREGRLWPRGARHAFEAAVVRAKIDNFRFHDCRHHFASWFVMRGGSLAALKALLGHSNFQMTLRYAHLAPDHLRAEMLKTELTSDFSAHSQHNVPGALLPATRALTPSAVSI